jgi:hypothetical protein
MAWAPRTGVEGAGWATRHAPGAQRRSGLEVETSRGVGLCLPSVAPALCVPGLRNERLLWHACSSSSLRTTSPPSSKEFWHRRATSRSRPRTAMKGLWLRT